MIEEITYRGFFGDGDHAFTLTDAMIIELEAIAQMPVGSIYVGFPLYAVPVTVMIEIIRLGLIGAGRKPEAAKRLVDAYATNRPLTEVFPLAFAILDARWNGKAPDSEAAATGDLGAALKAAA